MTRNAVSVPFTDALADFYTIPPHAPARVAEVYGRYTGLCDKWDALNDELQEARQAVAVAHAADLNALKEAFAEGVENPKVGTREQKARAKVESLETQRAGLGQALDQVGNELAEAIVEHRQSWTKAVTKAERDAQGRAAAALREAQAAFADLSRTRGADAWLEEFDVGEAMVGRQRQWPGGRVRVGLNGFGPLSGEHNPIDLLNLVAKQTHP